MWAADPVLLAEIAVQKLVTVAGTGVPVAAREFVHRVPQTAHHADQGIRVLNTALVLILVHGAIMELVVVQVRNRMM